MHLTTIRPKKGCVKNRKKRHFLNKNRYPAVEYRWFSLLIRRYYDPWWLGSIGICGYGRNALGVDISDLPVAGSAPEWYSEKAVTIGTSGVTTHLAPMPPLTGSMNVVNLLTSGLEDVVGATFAVEPDPEKAAVFLRRTIEGKRKALGLDARSVD